MIMYDVDEIKVSEVRPKVTIMGIGGAGGNMLNAILEENIKNTRCIALNTDAQALTNVASETKIVLGQGLVGGMGTGANPEIGKVALEESIELVLEAIGDSDIVFLLGGFGGGTASGVIPALVKVLQERQILTVTIATKPFVFEGSKRMQIAQHAITKAEEYSDTVIVVPNQKLFEYETLQNLSLSEAFCKINKVVVDSIRAVVDTIFSPGNINIDFADIKTTMTRMGRAVIGIGSATGEDRAIDAMKNAIESPLIENNSLKGARSIIINICSDETLSLQEINMIASFVYDEAHPDAHIILGSSLQKKKDSDEILVTIIVTGFEDQIKTRMQAKSSNLNNSFNYYNNINKKQQFYQPSNQESNQGYNNAIQGMDENLDFSQRGKGDKDNEKFDNSIEIPTYLRNQSAQK